MKQYRKNVLSKAIAVNIGLVTLLTLPALATAAVLEEVIVTAQKRAESLQDVPVAIHAVAGEAMRDGGIEKLESLAPSVPSLHISEGFGGDQFFMRGLGSGINFGFEQAVGQVLDGFFYGRSRFGRAQFLDVERVEVLKGPQGAIVGKNTTAGALNITSAKPTEEFEGWLSLTHQFEGGEGQVYEGGLSGEIADNLMARVALRYEDMDGFMDNVQTGEDDTAVEDLAGRISLLYEPTDDFSAAFQYTAGDSERNGRNMEISECSAGYLGFLAANGVSNQDCSTNYKRNSSTPRNGAGNFETQDTEFSTTGLTLTWDFEQFTLTSLTGYAEYEYLDGGDNDRSPVEFLSTDIVEDYEQLTQEFRIVSNGGERFDYIAGVYYQDNEQETVFDLHVVPAGGNTRHLQTLQETETVALFGNLTWHLDDSLDLTVEGRYTREEKEAVQEQFPRDIYTATPVAGGSGGPAGVFNQHSVAADRTETDFSPGVILEWSPDGDSMYYVSIKRGFKGGGFDHMMSVGTSLTQADIDDRFEFDEETVTAFELGGKLTLAEGAANFNFALFYNEFDDLQVSSQAKDATFAVNNAASAIIQGVEADLKWALSDALTFSFSAAYLDAEYDEFSDAPCYVLQSAGCNIPAGGDWSDGIQDLSNRELQFAPEFSFSTSLEHVYAIDDSLELKSFIQLYGQAETAMATDLDPNTFEDEWVKVDARISLSGDDGRWSVALVGRNLGDKTTTNFANDIPVFTGTYFRLIEAPRTLALQGNYRF